MLLSFLSGRGMQGKELPGFGLGFGVFLEGEREFCCDCYRRDGQEHLLGVRPPEFRTLLQDLHLIIIVIT